MLGDIFHLAIFIYIAFLKYFLYHLFENNFKKEITMIKKLINALLTIPLFSRCLSNLSYREQAEFYYEKELKKYLRKFKKNPEIQKAYNYMLQIVSNSTNSYKDIPFSLEEEIFFKSFISDYQRQVI